jgi:hypothetical protein
MRLRLFERLGRLAFWRSGSRAEGRGQTRDSRPRDDAGRHRRSAGATQPRFFRGGSSRRPDGPLRFPGEQPQPPAGFQPPPAGFQQPPAAFQQQAGSAAQPAVARADAWAGDMSGQSGNYGPGSGDVNGAGSGGQAGYGAAAGGLAGHGPAGGGPAGGGPAGGGPVGGGAGRTAISRPAAGGSSRHGGGVGRARIKEAPFGAAPAAMETVAVGQEAAAKAPASAAPKQPWYQVVGESAASGSAQAIDVAEVAGQASQVGPADARPAARGRRRAALPFAAPHPQGHPPTADGRQNCGPLEAILWRQWDAEGTAPPPEVIAAVERLASFPRQLQEKLAAGLDGIYVGEGGVPELDDMSALHGVPLPSGRATWDACAGAYGEHKIVVGSRPSPTPDVMCHEVGHALDDLDSPPGKWQSDSAEFRMIYDQCQPYIASDFHRQRGGLGRKEFFADAFAAIASGQRPALVDMLSGNTRIALRVMLYFNRRYGI